MDCPVHKVPFGAPLNRGYTGDPPSRSVTFANTERHAEQRGSSHRPERISDGSGVRTRSPISCAVADPSNRGVSVVLARLHLDDPCWPLGSRSNPQGECLLLSSERVARVEVTGTLL